MGHIWNQNPLYHLLHNYQFFFLIFWSAMTDNQSDSTSMTSLYSDLDATCLSVALLGSFTSFDKEKLDKERANWNSWSQDIYLVMSLNCSYDYVTGDVVAPDSLLEPWALRNWKSNDRSTCTFLSSAISDAEWKALSDPPRSDAKIYWEKLKTCHSSNGPVAQVYLLKQATKIVIMSPSESITKTIDKAADLVRHAYAMNSADGLAEETFLSIITLNTSERNMRLFNSSFRINCNRLHHSHHFPLPKSRPS